MGNSAVLIIILGFVIGVIFFDIYRNANSKIKGANRNISSSFRIDEDGTIIRDFKEKYNHNAINYCYKCGLELKIKSNFCPNCGAPLSHI